jgi:MFS family permease
VSSTPARQATFRDVFAVREFRALWASQILSEVGDRLTLVALTLLIYARTGSPLLAALTYAAGSLPWIVGSLVFSGLGDRMPRREVMVACDVIRALMVAVMLVPGIPVAVLVGVLYLTTMAQAPFEAARSAVLPDVLAQDRYALAATVMQTSFRVAMVAGAAVGGVAIACIGSRPVLGVDAATFLASAVLIRWGTRARPAPARSDLHALKQLTDGFRLLLGDKTIRTVMMLGWLIALYSIPEGIAAPYVARLSGGPVAAGLVVASGQAGAVLIAPFFARKIGPGARLRWMGPMAACTCAVLVLTVFHPGLVVSMAIFALSGTFAIYQIAANTAFVDCVPDERRSQAFGLASMGTVASQGGALLAAGAAAEVLPPSTVIAVGGGLGALAAGFLALRWRHLPLAAGHHPAQAADAPAPPMGAPAPLPGPESGSWAAHPARATRSVPASRCRPQVSHRPAHVRQGPPVHSPHHRGVGAVPSHRDHPLRLLAPPSSAIRPPPPVVTRTPMPWTPDGTPSTKSARGGNHVARWREELVWVPGRRSPRTNCWPRPSGGPASGPCSRTSGIRCSGPASMRCWPRWSATRSCTGPGGWRCGGSSLIIWSTGCC